MPYIHMTGSARKLFEVKGNGAESWNIPAAEKVRIERHYVGIAVFSPPASVLDLQTSSLPKDLRHLIILDIASLRTRAITSRQQVAILLHEIGHIVNPAPESGDTTLESELYADYYVRHCGYVNDFAAALKQMRDTGVHGFDRSSVDDRISLLRKNTESRLNLQNG